jgi:hypothetical protein
MYLMKRFFALVLTMLLSASAFGWELLPGAANDVGDGWVIGTKAEGGGFGIYRWNSTGWDKIPGGAVRIGGTYRTPWIVNNQNLIYNWTGSAWKLYPGTATDVGDGWVIGTTPEAGGFGIYRWNGASWQKMPGAAVRIGGTYRTPWVVNNQHAIFRWNGSAWVQTTGAANDVGDGWVIGTTAEGGGFGIYRWNGSGWQKIPGGAVSIGGAGGTPWIINSINDIFRW